MSSAEKSDPKKLCVWDVTLDAAAVDEATLKAFMPVIAKKWVFQKERAEPSEKYPEGYVHWQMRISTIKRYYEIPLIKELWDYADWWNPSVTGLSMNVSPTSNPGTKNFNYVMKIATRIDGPWADNDAPPPERMPRQFGTMENPFPYQQMIMMSLKNWEPRVINVVVDTKGKMGKSTLMGFAHWKKLGFKLPACNNYKDIRRMVCDIQYPKKFHDRWGGFMFDIPSGFRQEELDGMFTAIETIKDGYAYDDRYTFKEVWFDSPSVWVVMNELPLAKMTADRWKYWTINEGTKSLEAIVIKKTSL